MPTPALDQAQLERELAALPDWKHSGKEISKTYKLSSFAFAIEFVRQVGELAALADHHPDIDIRFDKVKIRLTTRAAGGVTGQDVALAHQIERLLEADPAG
jgi:4a-hydroxytetrahydrobiopterin dehydratase